MTKIVLAVQLIIALFMGGRGVLSKKLVTVPDTSLNDIEKIMEMVRQHPPTEFQEIILQRKTARELLQRKSYAFVLNDAVCHDGVSALFSYLKMNVQLELSLERKFLFW